MDRSDPPLYAATDPPTVKTEPPGPAADGAPAPDAAPAAGTSGDNEDAGGGEPVTPAQSVEPAAPEAQTEWPGASPAEPDFVPEPAETQADALVEEGPVIAHTEPSPQPAVAVPVAEGAIAPSSQMQAVGEPPAMSADQRSAEASAPASRGALPLLADWDRARVKSVAVRAGKVAAIVFCGWFTAVLFLILVYRFVNPPFSSLMAMQWVTGTSIEREWVPIEEISPNLVRAVIASEDGRFCRHWGIDFAEIAAAIRRTSQGVPRGASTITMQVAKNLFLWPAKSYVRKVIEVPLTYAIEIAWPKRRIMEVYLNIAEWGPGVFGAEAASQEHFRRSAARLSARQAAQLAVALPNPFQRDAGDPGPWTSRRASVIQARAARSPEAATCVLGGD